MGGAAERRLHFRHGPPPPQGKGDAVSRVWALSPPGTTDWAVFGRQVSGAWSLAWSSPSPGARHFCRRCPCAEPSSTSLRPRPRVPPKSPRGAPIPPRPTQDRRDSGVSAAVWGWVVWCPLITPTGRPYPSPAQTGPEGLGCIRRCVGVGGVVSPHNPHGVSLSLPGPGRTGGTRVYPPLRGGVPPRHRFRAASP